MAQSSIRELQLPTQWSLRTMFGLMVVIAAFCATSIKFGLGSDIVYVVTTGSIIGLAVVAIGVVLFLWGLVLFFTARSRTRFVLYGFTALLPPALGSLGSWRTMDIGIAFGISIVVAACVGWITYSKERTNPT